MNVYEKLNEARIRFQNANVKKSGKNTYANYTYYELADILPAINQIAKELKFTCVIRFTSDIASLDFMDCEKPEDKIVFTSPMSEANLKGCMAVQCLGGVITYIKRYLYQNCFEIVESDILDRTVNPSDVRTELKTLLENYEKELGSDAYNFCCEALKGTDNGKISKCLSRCKTILADKGIN